MAARGWPATLVGGRVGVRPLRLRDAEAWSELRVRNEAWLTPWEGRSPELHRTGPAWTERHSPGAFVAMHRAMRKESRVGRSLPFGVTWDGRLCGQVTVANVVRGAFESATMGYWVDGDLAGRGITPTAVALVADHCFSEVGLHRLEINVRPENAASRRVAVKLGFREEGLMKDYLFIDGAWRDHVGYALTAPEAEDGLLARVGRHTG